MRTAWLKNVLIAGLVAVTAWAQANPSAPQASAPSAKPAPHASHASKQTHAGGYLGVDIADLTPERAGELKLKDGHGAEVVMVDQDAPAAKVGLRERDVIVSFDGKKVNNSAQLREMIRSAPPGREVTLTVVRDGQPIIVKPNLGSRGGVSVARGPNGSMHLEAPDVVIPTIPAMAINVPGIHVLQYSARNGAVVEDLTPQLAEYFGVRGGEGVLVRQVLHATPAETAGLRAGDVIVKVGNQPVRCSADWRRALHTNQPTLPVTVVRERRTQTLSMRIPEPGPDTMQFNMPDLNSEMEELQEHLKELGPEIDQAAREAQMEMQRQLREFYRAQRAHAAAIEKARHEAQHDATSGTPAAPVENPK
jgi:serine protease Do